MTQELTTTSILSLFETNKEQRQTFALGVVNALESGEVDPLKIHLQVKCIEDIIKLLNSNTIYKRSVLESAKKFGQKSFDFMSSKVEIKETGVKYDYSKCGDQELEELNKQAEELDTKIKAKQKFLQTIPAKGVDIVSETGEVNTVYPPAKSSITNVIIILK